MLLSRISFFSFLSLFHSFSFFWGCGLFIPGLSKLFFELIQQNFADLVSCLYLSCRLFELFCFFFFLSSFILLTWISVCLSVLARTKYSTEQRSWTGISSCYWLKSNLLLLSILLYVFCKCSLLYCWSFLLSSFLGFLSGVELCQTLSSVTRLFGCFSLLSMNVVW